MTTKLLKLFSIGLAFMAISCNEEKKEDAKEAGVPATDTTASAKVNPEPVFQPFDVVEIAHTVKDFDKWKPVFKEDSTPRKENGLSELVLGRAIDNPNDVLVVLECADVSKAKTFAADPRLKNVMEKGGVNSKPDAQFYKIVRFNPEAKEKKWVIINHRVKDFDAWLKVYDQEGAAKRAEEGLFDAALGRGIDDPNLVHIVFDVKDVDKAKAALNSEEKKKLMQSAGVEGKPAIKFYNTAE